MPDLSHNTSKLLAEVYNVNSDYIDRLFDLKNLAVIATNEAKNIQGVCLNMDFKPLLAAYKAVTELSFLWCEYLEENQHIIREADKERPINGFLCSIEDDFCEYLERAETLKSLIALAGKELDQLHSSGMDFRTHSAHLNSLTSVIRRAFCTLCTDIEAEQDVLGEMYPQKIAEGA